VIHRLGEGKKALRRPFEAYDRRRDRAERQDLVGDAPVLVGYARQRIDELSAAPTPGPAVDAQKLERLRALGYVQD
jgi:hypothetical protein